MLERFGFWPVMTIVAAVVAFGLMVIPEPPMRDGPIDPTCTLLTPRCGFN